MPVCKVTCLRTVYIIDATSFDIADKFRLRYKAFSNTAYTNNAYFDILL